MICFLALVRYRVLRMRLKSKDKPYSPERMLEIMGQIQHHKVMLHRKQLVFGLSTITPEQRDLFETVGLPKPRKEYL